MSNNNIENKNKPVAEEIDDFTVVNKAEPEAREANAVESRKKITLSAGARKALVCVAAVFAVIIIALTVYGATVPQDIILDGIAVGGIDIGGMSKDQALAELSGSDSVMSSEVVINANNKRFVVLPSDIDAELDTEATVEKAYSVGKGSNIYANALAAIKFKLSGNKFLPILNYNEEKFSGIINEIGLKAVGSVLVEHSVRFDDGGKAYVVPGKSGYNNDPSKVMEMIKTALIETDTNEINVDFEKTKPADLTIDSLDALIRKDPVNATFVLEGNNVKVVEAENGRYIDKAQCKKIISQVVEGGKEIEVPYMTTEAEIKSDDLKGKLFNATLGSYTTRYAAGGNRGSNVDNAARRIHGKILLPGETFSFNQTVGKRTVANGFKSAPEYQNGQTVTGIGGGTCQVSTTVYSAALYADLKIVSRSNHSMSVSYVPLGQDATVTDSGIDLKFMNDTNFPVKITAVTGGGKITVSIIGTAPETPKTVKISHRSADGGIRTTRIVYDENGKVIKEENMGLSKYKPHEEPATDEGPEATEGEATPAPEEVQDGQETPSPSPSAEPTDEPENTSTPEPEKEEPSVPAGTVETPEKQPENSTPVKTDTE